MPGLAETTALLARLRRTTQVIAFAGDSDETPLTETADFGPNPAGLRMLSYVPKALPPGAPLVVVLHGCGQRAAAHAVAGGWVTLADRYGFAVLAPEQSPANNPSRCFNWFDPKARVRGQGEAASIRAMVAHAITEHRLNARRVFVVGLSAGGGMAAAILANYPEVFAGGAIIAGVPFGVAEDLTSALGVMHAGSSLSAGVLGGLARGAAPTSSSLPRISIWHGDVDATVTALNAGAIARQWAAANDLPTEPDEAQALPGRTRTLWRSPRTGQVLIECNLVRGMGHGTPMATAGADGLGAVAPFMIEAGVSSTLEIARFWGLDGSARARREVAPSASDGAEGKIQGFNLRQTAAALVRIVARALRAIGLIK